MSIPNRLIFIWFGKNFPYGNYLAMQSARRQCQPDEILLLCDQPDAIRPHLGPAAEWPELKLLPADVSWFEDLPAGTETVRAIFEKSRHPPTRANLLRLACLYRHGGIYLDFDTVTLRDLEPLRHHSGFCGEEHLVLPLADLPRANPFKWARAGVLLALRDLFARLPSGWKTFRLFEGLFSSAANNAVLGAQAKHPLLTWCFQRIQDLPQNQWHRRYRLGTHLLQEAVASGCDPTFQALPPRAFFPLGPEVSNHWFRPGTAAHFLEMAGSDTWVVHWYNSVEARYLKQPLTAHWVAQHSDTAMAEMVRRFG
jgi:hypothetical protein